HAWHFEVGDDQMAAVLGDEFGGLQAVGRENYAIAVFLQHTAHEFADADGVIGDDHDTFVLNAIDSVGGNTALGDGGGTGREDARGACGSLNGLALARLAGDYAIQIEKKNQAAIGRDRGAGEKFYAAQIFAEALDHNFVFAKHLFDHQADLAVVRIGDHHAEVAIDGFECGQTEIGVETDDFGDHVADFGEQLAADIFNFIGAE